MSDNKLAFYDFSGGINTSTTKVMLGYGAKKLNWDESFNVELYKNQGVERMKGNRTFIEPPENENISIIAMCEYPKSSEGFVYAQTDGKIMHYDNVSRAPKLIHNYNKPISKADFSPYLDGIVVIASDCEALYYNVNSATQIKPLGAKNASGAVLHADCVSTYASRVWLSSSSTLYYSALGRYDDWTSADDAGYIANFHSSVSKISALAPYCGNLAIFKPDGVYLLSGTSPDNFSVIKFADKGVEGSKAVCTCNNKQYFFNADGLFALSQVGELSQIMMSTNIAYPIQESFKSVDRSRIRESFCVPYEKKNQIWFYLPFNEEGSFKTVLVYDFAHNCWTKRIEEQAVSAAANVFGEIMSGCKDGRVLLENIGSTFDGKAIKFRFSTPFFHLGNPSERKIIEDFALLVDDAGENSFKFSVSKDFIKEIKTDTEYIKTVQNSSLIWASIQELPSSDNCWECDKGSLWARSFECAISMQIFDSNLSIALHIEGEKEGDDFRLVGIEFKELINDF